MEYVYGTMKHPFWKRRWWLRTRPCESVVIGGLRTASSEFYTPWWAWVFDLTHRLIFGRSLLKD